MQFLHCQYHGHRNCNKEREFLVDREMADADIYYHHRNRSVEHDANQTNRMTHSTCTPLLYKTVFLCLRGIRETSREFLPDRYSLVSQIFQLHDFPGRQKSASQVLALLNRKKGQEDDPPRTCHAGVRAKGSLYLLRHIASLDTLRSVTITSCTLPQAPPRLRASLESLTLTLVETAAKFITFVDHTTTADWGATEFCPPTYSNTHARVLANIDYQLLTKERT